MNSGGDIFDDSDPCFNLGVNGYTALLADADVCAQQENADYMITFAKSRGVMNSADLIELAVAYRKLPRQSVQIMGFYPSTPYCSIAPINEELMGVCNEQPEGVTAGLYGGPNWPIMPFGDDGSCPYGQTPDVGTCSCLSSSSEPSSSSVYSIAPAAATSSGDVPSSETTSAAAISVAASQSASSNVVSSTSAASAAATSQ
ncbi:hypothetical protein B0H11DRAFT_1173214 [Mycena galericulata]|nr:hypothetical protein B0H11DRAFT_1173214 [Mycena galericulata]